MAGCGRLASPTALTAQPVACPSPRGAHRRRLGGHRPAAVHSLRINNFASDPEVQASIHGWSRIGRQFYDVWALLGRQNVLDLLADRPTTGEVLAICFEISLAFAPDKPLPHGGLAACIAFNPDGPLAGRLRTEHEIAMRDLYYGTNEPPTFDEVLDRVHASRALLDIEIAS